MVYDWRQQYETFFSVTRCSSYSSGVYSLPLPFEAEWDKEHTLATAVLFVSQLVASIDATVPGTQSTIRRLLVERYAHDWAIYTVALRYNNSINAVADDLARLKNITTEHKELYFENTLVLKIEQSVTENFAPLFISGFIESDTVYESLSATLKDWDEEDASTCSTTVDNEHSGQTPAGRCSKSPIGCVAVSGSEHEKTDDDSAVLGNKAAVMHIKLCDYIEDVFLHIAQSKYSDVKGADRTGGAVGDLPRAVLLLFQYLKVSVDVGL